MCAQLSILYNKRIISRFQINYRHLLINNFEQEQDSFFIPARVSCDFFLFPKLKFISKVRLKDLESIERNTWVTSSHPIKGEV